MQRDWPSTVIWEPPGYSAANARFSYCTVKTGAGWGRNPTAGVKNRGTKRGTGVGFIQEFTGAWVSSVRL